MALFLKCAPGDLGAAGRFVQRASSRRRRPRDRVPVAGGSGRSRLRPKPGRRWSLSRRLKSGSAASIRAVQPDQVGGLVKVDRSRGGLATPGEMELDAAVWLNTIILPIRFRVNRAPKKVRYEPKAPARGRAVHGHMVRVLLARRPWRACVLSRPRLRPDSGWRLSERFLPHRLASMPTLAAVVAFDLRSRSTRMTG
jgi:hypothetical protein